MRAMVITAPGGPDVFALEQRPDPQPAAGDVVVAVRAFGLNHAELYFRRGTWPGHAISGIECVGEVAEDTTGALAVGTKVIALMGGMGRERSGSYAEFASVPASNVQAVESDLSWTDLAAVPESYATAWCCLIGNLRLRGGETVIIRGATSALGQAAVNIAACAGSRVVATTRRVDRVEMLKQLGAEDVIVGLGSAQELAMRGLQADAVLDLLGTATLLDSIDMLRAGGRVCVAGFLSGTGGLEAFHPVFQLSSGVHLSAFATVFALGSKDWPLSGVPFRQMLNLAESGRYKAKPLTSYSLEQLGEAHARMERGDAGGKLVVRV